jgi:early secretory antigenic target protein ESAT-6
MSEQKWNFSGIEAGSSEIQGSVQTTQGLLEEGKASLTRLADAWGGNGAEAYQAVQRRWDETSAELNTSLRDLANTISEVSGNMQATENANANLFRQ